MNVESFDIPTLVSLLVTRLNDVLPEATRVEAKGREIEFFGFDGPYSRTEFDPGLFADADEGPFSGLVYAIERLLSNVQDDVAHATRGLAWPTAPQGAADPLLDPWAKVEGTQLCFGYKRANINLAPIPLSEIAVGRD